MALVNGQSLNLKLFNQLKVQEKRSMLDYCTSFALISNLYQCPEYGKQIILMEYKEVNDSFTWVSYEKSASKTEFCKMWFIGLKR